MPDWTYLSIDDAMFKKGRADWLFVIPNYAMLNDDLLPGDLAAVKKSKTFTAGHLICASQGNQIFIGYGRVHAGVKYIHLDVDDKRGQPISHLDGEEPNGDISGVRLWGIVIGVVRRSVRVKNDFVRNSVVHNMTMARAKSKKRK